MHRDLVERAMAGDHAAFSELARSSIGRLYSVARLILRDDAWMRQLPVRACYREARGDQRRMRHEARVVPLGLVGDPAVALGDRDQLDRGCGRLSPVQRALVVVHFYLDLPLKETAELLGLPWARPSPVSIARSARCVPASTPMRACQPSGGGSYDVPLRSRPPYHLLARRTSARA